MAAATMLDDLSLAPKCYKGIRKEILPEYRFDGSHYYVENLLQDIKDHITFKQWFFGHWHDNFTYRNYRCMYGDIIELSNSPNF